MRRVVAVNKAIQGSQFDKIFRENMHENLPTLIENVLRLDLTTVEELKDDVQYTKERKTDLLKKVKDKEGNVFILHIEFQYKNDKKRMVYRMAEYSVMLQRKYDGLPVLQYVIYIGKGKSAMQTMINTKDMQFRYNLTALSSVDYDLLLKSENIEGKMLAILGNMNKQDPKLVLKDILDSIKQEAPDSLTAERYIKQLHVLVQLRNLEKDLKQVMDSIETFFKIERDPFYQDGIKVGMEKGIEEGMEKGKLEVAYELKKMGIAVSDIVKWTGLAAKKVEEI
ncbi:Rpn family recombination-promoting nuclease/putative transposase [Pedobacter nyackensis]|uniref:Rpn family recombination-promoting nuclease/putative transposase n=1 Tax=Pedobacter nyackensis TaxID=475255 RepID=UPI00292E86A5|nr:Rpn family recombination-promoting nuclease/putative transposase [Pedobacter nyackensis]